jgi:hypothetical protein
LSAASFDPWAALATIRAEAEPAGAAVEISKISRISRGEPLPSDNAVVFHGNADTQTAVRLDAAIRAGATWAWCPTGALDVVLPDGRLWLLSPTTAGRMKAARLLPDSILLAKG